MIVTVCLNPCIDRMVDIDQFAYGGMNRIRALSNDGSGKGVNVALAARELGLATACIGLMPEDGAHIVRTRLENAGCLTDFLTVAGSVRVNTKLRNLKDGVVTEINESGVAVTQEDLRRMEELVRTKAQSSTYMVMTGSLPPSCPDDTYGRLMAQCATYSSAHCILDAEGDKLLGGLSAHPFLIKPNRYELEMAVKRELPTHKDLLAGLRQLVGDSMAVVSMGGEGALFSCGGQAFYAPRLDIEVVSTVGAGDCMVAGMLYALENGMSVSEVFRHGIAGGTAGCMTPGTALLRREDFFAQLQRVQIVAIA